MQKIFVPIFLYSITGSMFIPVLQSLIFYKACVIHSSSNSTFDCSITSSTAAKNAQVHTFANNVMLLSSMGLCVAGILTSRFIGSFGDKNSHRSALLLPFAGLLISDVTLIAQAYYIELSPYFFVVSEVIFGLFGGYMSILSCAFAAVSSSDGDKTNRASSIARMEGVIALGGTIGFLLSSQLRHTSYLAMFIFFFVVHIFAAVTTILIPKTKSKTTRTTLLEATEKMKRARSSNLVLLYGAFAVSFFAFIGTTRILFFYLKQRFFWDAEMFGYLRASIQATSTVMALFVYPYLKSLEIGDVSLTLLGLVSRTLGKLWFAVAWNDVSIFAVVIFEMFSKFPASGLRSLIASNVEEGERGAAFSLVAATEAACNLLSSIVFHLLFPWSIPFFPQLSFVLMAVFIVPPIFLIFARRVSLETSDVTSPSQNKLVDST